MKANKVAVLGIIISCALIIHFIEGFIPVPLPGARLGLANIMTIITMVLFGPLDALLVLVLRSVLGSILAGNPTAILYSLSGGILSLLVMSIMHKRFGRHFSMMGISTLGAAFHNIGQLMAASLVFGTIGIMLAYLPVLMLFALFTGSSTGVASHYIIKFFVRHRGSIIPQ